MRKFASVCVIMMVPAFIYLPVQAKEIIMTPEQQRELNTALWEQYDYTQYPTNLTGFTFNLQQIASVTQHPAIRVQVGPPGYYKGCLVRMPNGDLIATPAVRPAEGGFRSVVYRSTDEGLSWEQIAAPPDLPGKEHGLAVLSDGTLLHINYSGHLSRSEDGGYTWECNYMQLPFGTMSRNIEEREDGTLVIVGVNTDEGRPADRLVICTSQDKGLSWTAKEVPVGTDYTPFLDYEGARVMAEEPSWLTLPDGRMVLIFRAEQSRVIGDEPPTFALQRYGEAGDHMVITESTDGGEHWSTPRNMTGYGEPHGYLTLLQDGRLMCTYANYHLPYGIFAIFSEDLGRTWDLEHRIMLGLSTDIYVGWPVTLQLPDGSMITSYATTAYSSEKRGEGTAFQIVKWELPSQ